MSERVAERYCHLPLEIARDGSLGHGPLLLLAQMASCAHPHEHHADCDTVTRPKCGWAKAAGLPKGRIQEYLAELCYCRIIVDVDQLAWSRAELLSRHKTMRRRIDLVPLTRSDVPVHARRAHLVIQTYGNPCYPGQQRLARNCGCGLSAFKEALKVLRGSGLLTIERRPNQTCLYTW